SLGVSSPRPSRAAPQRAAKHYDLALKVFRIVLGRVTDSYVEPARIKPRAMLLSALDAIEKRVAEVLIEESPDKKKVTVKVEDVQRSFDLSSIDSPWALSAVIKKVLRFIQPHLHADTKPQDVEYAAINGMLDTLDPHSLLLRPEIYAEMKLSTRGHFGGLGIVISMINGVLTVMKPIKGTPAEVAGLKACDQILKIGEESTVNMTLSQAVKRLRGVPGSNIAITVLRGGWKRPEVKTLTRAIIKVDSVKSRMLAKKIGYISLSSFQGNSLSDIKAQLEKLHKKGMRGLVLDLRNNPGGLLEQAIKISDLFIDSGTLLTTVGHAGKRREEKRAHREGTEPRYPIAVLVNGGSASASEIVAGALKNLDRGVIIGKRTFGKGSVQVLYNNDDGSALKLTIAQYLTPGDVSIQTVGITPDVLTDPVVVRPKYIRLRHGDDAPREKDLAKHLTHQNAARSSKPLRRVRYLAVAARRSKTQKKKAPRKNLCLFRNRSCKPAEEERFVVDFQIKLARDLLASAKDWRASRIIAGSKRLFARVDVEEEQRIAEALKKLNVDWTEAPKQARLSLPPGASAPRLAVKLVTDPPGGVVAACRSTTLRVTVKNVGGTTAYRLRGISESVNGLLDKRELVFGRLEPGDERSWEVPLRLRDAATRVDEVDLRFFDDSKTRYPKHHFSLRSKGVDRPIFAYGYQLIDDIKGNRDGQVQRGEHVRLFVRVKNSGKGPAFRTIARLKNLAGVGIFIRKGRFELGRLEPGESKTAAFTFEVQPSYRKRTFKVELAVVDEGLREYVSEKLSFSVAKGSLAPKPAKGWVRVDKPLAGFRAWGAASAPVVGSARRGSSFKVLGRTAAGWYRVAATSKRPAFLSPKVVTTATGPGSRGRGFELRWQVTPPTITLKVPTYATTKKTLRIHGSAHDETKLQDLYIFVRNPKTKISERKIFYRSNRKSKSPKQIDFNVDVPLWPGANYVTVFARESNDTQSRETVVIFRKRHRSTVVEVKSAAKPTR
ncbi:MAG: peptidase S41, partial [Proteobacteria bacterium]